MQFLSIPRKITALLGPLLLLFFVPTFAHASVVYSGMSASYSSPAAPCSASSGTQTGNTARVSCSNSGSVNDSLSFNGSWNVTISINGSTQTFTGLTCSGQGSGTDYCTSDTIVTVGGEVFDLNTFIQGEFKGDGGGTGITGIVTPTGACSGAYSWNGTECAPLPLPTCSLSGSPASIVNGNSSTLSWSTTNATSFSINQNVGGVTPVSSGSVSVSPTVTTTYTGTATGAGGTSTCSATVTVTAPPAPTCTLTASPTSITSGGSSQLSWTTTNASSFSINQGIGAVTPTVSGYRLVSPTTNTTYTGIVSGTGGTATCNATVSISANPPPTVDLTAYPTSVSAGGSSMLTWNSSYATSCTGTGFSTGGATSNSTGVSTGALSSNKTYSISCTGSGGTATDSVTVSIAANPPPTVTLTATPSTITSGNTSTLSWTSSNATSCVNSTSNWKATALSGSTTTPALSSNQTYTITCSNAAGSSNASATVTVSAGLPDLIMYDITPNVIPSNTSKSFSASVKNKGAGDAGTFSDKFRYYSDSACTQLSGTLGGNSGVVTNASLTKGTLKTDTTSANSYAISGTYYMKACADYNNQVAESDETNNCGPCTRLRIGPTIADLQMTNINPFSTLAGQATTFFANVKNTGDASTGGVPFYVLFQKSTQSDASDAADIGTYHVTTNLSAYTGAATASLSYTFPSPGLYYLRTCADKSSATNTGVITEQYEDNNCEAAWEPVGGTLVTVGQNGACGTTHWNCAAGTADASTESTTVGADGTITYLWSCKDQYGVGTTASCSEVIPPPPTITFNNNGPVNRGGVARLTWSSTNATSCTGTGFSTAGATSNATGVSTSALYTDTSYQITCTGLGGTTGPQGTTVTVIQPKVQIYADPSRVRSGGTVTITWSATGVNSCSVGGPNMTTSNTFSAATSTQSNVSVTSQSTYTITCTEADGTTQDVKSATVNVVPTFQTF